MKTSNLLREGLRVTVLDLCVGGRKHGFICFVLVMLVLSGGEHEQESRDTEQTSCVLPLMRTGGQGDSNVHTIVRRSFEAVIGEGGRQKRGMR